MPKSRQPHEVWQQIRHIVWKRDKRRCVRCREYVKLEEAHIDHICSGKLANNSLRSLRTLCSTCHILRADSRHRGMMAKAIESGKIPPDWRKLVWEG